jgi:integrase
MLFTWAWKRDMIADNPCERIPPPAKAVERDRVLRDSEIVAVWNAADQLPPPFRQFVRLLMLTGQRRTEVATMRWDDITGDTWVIPRERVKKDRPHAVPLTATALGTLAELPRFVNGGFAISTTGGLKASTGFSKMKEQLDKLARIEPFSCGAGAVGMACGPASRAAPLRRAGGEHRSLWQFQLPADVRPQPGRLERACVRQRH